MDKELIMCIAMYVIIFLWIFICPVIVNGGEDKCKRSRTMTENKDIPQFVACGLKMGNCGYQIPYDMAEHDRIIRAAAIDEVIKSLEAQFLMQNNPNSKFVETIVLHRDFIDALEQLKGNSDER